MTSLHHRAKVTPFGQTVRRALPERRRPTRGGDSVYHLGLNHNYPIAALSSPRRPLLAVCTAEEGTSMHQIRLPSLRPIPATTRVTRRLLTRSSTSRRRLPVACCGSSSARSIYPTCEVFPVRHHKTLIFSNRNADVSLLAAYSPTTRAIVSPLSFTLAQRHVHIRAGMAANGIRSISSSPSNSSLRQRQQTGKEAAHDHDHNHSHEHSHSIFGHTHSHGEEGHSHDAEQIVAALQGSGERSTPILAMTQTDHGIPL